MLSAGEHRGGAEWPPRKTMNKTNRPSTASVHVITLPTIHLNGTSASMLLEGYTEAMLAISAAERAIQNIEFNARDYYPSGPEAWTKAVNERRDQLQKLKDVSAYQSAHVEHVADIIAEREARKAERDAREAARGQS